MSAPSKVSHEDFVVAWMTSESVQAVAKTTGMSVNGVYSRLGQLRRSGVNLPKMKRSDRLDQFRIAQLNSLMNKHKKKE